MTSVESKIEGRKTKDEGRKRDFILHPSSFIHQLHTRTGFTLVELSIVIVILMVLMSFAAPSLSRFTAHKKLQGEAQKIAATIETARSYAVSQRDSYHWFISASAKEYYYYRAAAVTGSVTGRQAHLDTINRLDNSIAAATGDQTIVFTARGTVDAAADTTTTVRSASGNSIDIVTNRRTGKVTVGNVY